MKKLLLSTLFASTLLLTACNSADGEGTVPADEDQTNEETETVDEEITEIEQVSEET
ncbi:MAG: hypothetical protein U5K84_11875 [Alkalibacterium sp.]|nr:hypothetical protein [Alkalibacterium sp.]